MPLPASCSPPCLPLTLLFRYLPHSPSSSNSSNLLPWLLRRSLCWWLCAWFRWRLASSHRPLSQGMVSGCVLFSCQSGPCQLRAGSHVHKAAAAVVRIRSPSWPVGVVALPGVPVHATPLVALFRVWFRALLPLCQVEREMPIGGNIHYMCTRIEHLTLLQNSSKIEPKNHHTNNK